LPADEEAALDFARELLTTHGVSDAAYEAALAQFGEQGVVEMASLIGYFAMVSWVMNVARTPANQPGEPLRAFPA
jgi:4-carboxymuconolactone decarboxylase